MEKLLNTETKQYAMEFRTINSSNRNNSLISVVGVPGTHILHWDIYLWAFINAILLICILGGNALTIIAVRTCHRLRSLISNMFICSLAVSDFVVGLGLPYHVSFYMGTNWGHIHELCLIRFFLTIFACSVSISTLIAISVDRYIAIIYPFRYRRYITRRVAKFIIAITWCVGAIVAALPMFWNNWRNGIHCEFDEVLPPWYMAGVIALGYAIIWWLMFFMYWRILKEASKQAKKMHNSSAKRKSFSVQPDCKSVQVVLIIMGSFSLCWLPYLVVACVQIFKIFHITALVYNAAFSLAMTNSAMNPIVYAWKSLSFRKAFFSLLHCKSPNRYQTTIAINKSSPMSLKQCAAASSATADKRFSVYSGNVPINHFVEGCVISGTDVEVCVTNATAMGGKSEDSDKIYTVSDGLSL